MWFKFISCLWSFPNHLCTFHIFAHEKMQSHWLRHPICMVPSSCLPEICGECPILPYLKAQSLEKEDNRIIGLWGVRWLSVSIFWLATIFILKSVPLWLKIIQSFYWWDHLRNIPFFISCFLLHDLSWSGLESWAGKCFFLTILQAFNNRQNVKYFLSGILY